VSEEDDGGPDRRRRRAVVAFAILLLVLLAAVIAVAAIRPRGPLTLPLPPGVTGGASAPGERVGSGPGTGPGGPAGTPGPGAGPGSSAGPDPSAGPPVTPPPSEPAGPPVTPPPAAPAPLTARYSSEGGTGPLGLSGYTGRVTIANPGEVSVSGWTVTVSLPNGARATRPSGATVTQSRNVATFAPVSGTNTVAPGEPVAFTFVVEGLLAGQPTGCAIDGRPCG
jgi:hypothetical protein